MVNHENERGGMIFIICIIILLILFTIDRKEFSKKEEIKKSVHGNVIMTFKNDSTIEGEFYINKSD